MEPSSSLANWRSAFEPISKAITCCSIRRLHSRRLGEDAGLGLTGTHIESIEAVARVRAEETRSQFAEVLVRREIAMGEGPHAVEHRASGSWRQESGYAPVLVANRARFFDLVVLGRSERAIGQPYTDHDRAGPYELWTTCSTGSG
jgi:hypothetical protein